MKTHEKNFHYLTQACVSSESSPKLTCCSKGLKEFMTKNAHLQS